jgi:alkaline phosphatase D
VRKEPLHLLNGYSLQTPASGARRLFPWFIIVAFAFSQIGCTSTARRPIELQRIAFGSCAKQDRPQPIWDTVLAENPDLFIFVGDNIYADTEDMKVMRETYAQFAKQPGFTKLRKTIPILATWDDHDYGADDAGAKYPQKEESQRIFLDFFNVPRDDPAWNRPGVYSAHVFGPPGRRVQIILLDTRYFRGPLARRGGRVPGLGPYIPQPDPNVTMLGEDQWSWLEEQLRIPADLRIIGSSIQVVAEEHGWEKWMNFPRERLRLFRLIRDTAAEGVVFISGDRHFAELSRQAGTGVDYPLYDLTSSSLNSSIKTARLESNRHRVGLPVFADNFGLIEIDWNAPDPLLALVIMDENGERRIEYTIPIRLLHATR